MAQRATADWYGRISEKLSLPKHCPIAATDRCPRYFVSLRHASAANALDVEISQEISDSLNQKWAASEPFIDMDRAVSSGPGRGGGDFSNVGGFCPEVTARIFGEYCSNLANFPDEDARRTYNAELDKEKTKADDPRRIWMIYLPKHYSECSEFRIYAELGDSSRTKAKSRKSIPPKLRFKVLARDGYRCVYCGATGETTALHVDHKISRIEGGTDDIANLVTACECCNLGKGGKSAIDHKSKS